MIPDSGNADDLPKPVKTVPERMLYPVKDVAVLLGNISQRKVWSLIAEGRLETEYLDGRRLVPHESLMAFRKTLKPTRPDATHPGGGAGSGPGGPGGTGPKTDDSEAFEAVSAA
jgi:hypothetical protein